jgi:glycosyltransferase involved in cell wall biosynthesis
VARQVAALLGRRYWGGRRAPAPLIVGKRTSNVSAAGTKIRVVRVLPVLDFGGVESRVTLQARLLDRNAFDLRVCTFHKAGRAARAIRDAGIEVDVCGADPSARNVLATVRMTRYLARLRPDVVHASIAEANVHCLVAAKLARVPVVIAEEVGAPNHSSVARAVFALLYRAADAVVGVTRATCDAIMEQDHAPGDRVRLVYNCAGPEYFPDPPEEIRVTNGAPREPFKILLVGRLVPVKNQELFVEAFARVAAERSDVELDIVGDGPLKEELARRIQELGIGNRVHLLGFRRDVRELLRRADVFALPSLSEGCSISLVEAMATGVFVIGSRVPGNLEVMEDLAQEWTVGPMDVDGWARAIRRSVELERRERARLARRAQEIAYARFSPPVYIRELERLYQDLFLSKRPGPESKFR